ncbi:MAG: two-component regulator propeller domain-containing protein [Bacteroides sp.]
MCKKICIQGILWIVMLATSGLVTAQTQRAFRHLNVVHGLSSNNVKAFLRDSEGFLWVGTENGLNRYDGYRFKAYWSDRGSVGALPFGDVSQLQEDGGGNLWIGNDVYCLYRRETDSFETDVAAALRRMDLYVQQQLEATYPVALRGHGGARRMQHELHDVAYPAAARQLALCGSLLPESRRLRPVAQQQSYPPAPLRRTLLPLLSHLGPAGEPASEGRIPQCVCVDEIEVDESLPLIRMGQATAAGVSQLQPVDAFARQQASTTAATQAVRFVQADGPGHTVATASAAGAATEVRGVQFARAARGIALRVRGTGTLEVHTQAADGPLLVAVPFSADNWQVVRAECSVAPVEAATLCFVWREGDLQFDEWQFLE